MTARRLSAVPDQPAPVQPYAFAARAYFRAGWSPLPLPPGEKSYPPTGYTGGKGRAAEPDQVERWIRVKPNGNVALRMPPTLLGIDVDAYSGKDGAATIAAASAEWGALPATWISTSRTDGTSGIRLYRIPEGLSWPGGLTRFGGGVELCRWDHRYVIVAPSVHPSGGQYHWFAPDGSRATGDAGAAEGGDWEFPSFDELPALPEAWVKGLTEGKRWEERAEEDLDPEEVTQWILDRPGGRPCDKMQQTLDTWLRKVSAAGEDGGAHDGARDAVWSVLRDAAGGHTGLVPCLAKLMAAHKEALRLRRPEKAAAEWQSLKARGVRKVAAEGPPDDDDPCELTSTARAPRSRNRGSEGMDFARDDIGNGQRFALQWRDEVRWVPAYSSWYVWRDRIWEPDNTGEIIRMATKTVRGMAAEAQYLEEPKEKAAFMKFVRASSNDGKISSMLKMAASNKGISVGAEAFDTNPSHLVCSNGTVVLPIEFSPDLSVKRVPSLQEHLNTIETGTAYSPDALGTSPEWNKFLERFQPDASIREWLQKLAGYSLFGRNPRRLMIVCIGETSTGKSTFAEVIGACLGPYAGSANMTIFRDNQDEKPRPDLIRVLPKRFVYAEEASKSWHLHPDQIKRLTGGTPVTARTLQAKVYVDMVPHFTPWLLTNAAPTIEGADAALWRRLVVVPFDVEIPKSEEDAKAKEELFSVAGRSAVLAWLVEGYRMYLADPESIQEIPEAAVLANRLFRSEISDLAQCLEEICEFGEPDAYRAAPADLYAAYQMWCGSNGVHSRDILSATKFGRELNGMKHVKKAVKIEGKMSWVRLGIRLKGNWSKIKG